MLSIIIPTYNEEKYLPKLLNSIIRQRIKTEIIVADNNSTDNTRRIAEKYRCQVVKGGLPAKGRNNGAKTAKGDILLFLDADLVLSKHFLKDAINEFNKRKIDVAIATIRAKSDKNVDKFLYLAADMFLKSCQYFKALGSGCCIMARSELHKKLKGFKESMKYGEDTDYLIRGSKHGKFRVLKAKLYISPRRLEIEGRLKTSLKYIMSAYNDIIGKKNNKIEYVFYDYTKERKKSREVKLKANPKITGKLYHKINKRE